MNPTQTVYCPYPTSHLTPRALNQCEWWRFRGEWSAPGVICRITDSVHARSDRTPTYYQQRHITQESVMIWHVFKRQEKKIDSNDSRSQLNGKEVTPRAETEICQHKLSVASQLPHEFCYSPSLCQHQIWMGYSSHSLCVHVQACRRVCRVCMCVRRLESSRTFIYYAAGEEIEWGWVIWWHILKGLHSSLFLSPLLFPVRTFDIGQCLKKWASLQFRYYINGAQGNTMYMRAFLNHLTFLLLGDSS